MNAHQRRKLLRHRERSGSSGLKHRLVRDWDDLAQLPESETHRLEIDVDGCNGWIKDKWNEDAFGHYLSTHTFYGSTRKHSTLLLRKCGFNVTVENWDIPNAPDEKSPPNKTL